MFEGFSPNGLENRIQRKELHIPTPVKIDFDDFCDVSYVLQLLDKYNLKNSLFGPVAYHARYVIAYAHPAGPRF